MSSFRAGAGARPEHARDGDARATADAAVWPQPDSALASCTELDLYLRRRFLPIRRDAGVTIVALADTSPENIAWLRAAYGSVRCVEVPGFVLMAEIRRRFDDRLTDDAVFALARKAPALSARRVVTPVQAVALVLLAVLILAGSILCPLEMLRALIVAMSMIFGATVLFRVLLAWFGTHRRAQGGPRGIRCPDSALPLYTVLVPLFREARVLPMLIRSLRALDYPREHLQALLVVEDDDQETASAAEALAVEPWLEVVRVPPSFPRTKPKAANFALRFARGDFVVIYDAEDRPEPDQLRKAVAEFRRLDRTTACLQARLAFFNTERWMPRLAALDYRLWFGLLLQGLDRLGVPMPLGGTSNHFRVAVLRAIHAWDPFNVTEDADLGIRLAALGYRVSMLDSTTHEEAPTEVAAWIRQRSRWLKGYMQTWLVHCRCAPLLIGQVGIGGFLAFQLFIGGAVLSALVNPILWTIFIVSIVFAVPIFDNASGHDLGAIAALGVIGSNLLLTLLTVAGSKRTGTDRPDPYGLTVTLYWLLVSIAGYRALWHLIVKPFHWEKTEHGLTGTGDA
jgi:cellulose synthase/poly-beta-1,6-N-acetylglucosamine synthase-like glycosyltransferase